MSGDRSVMLAGVSYPFTLVDAEQAGRALWYLAHGNVREMIEAGVRVFGEALDDGVREAVQRRMVDAADPLDVGGMLAGAVEIVRATPGVRPIAPPHAAVVAREHWTAAEWARLGALTEVLSVRECGEQVAVWRAEAAEGAADPLALFGEFSRLADAVVARHRVVAAGLEAVAFVLPEGLVAGYSSAYGLPIVRAEVEAAGVLCLEAPSALEDVGQDDGGGLTALAHTFAHLRAVRMPVVAFVLPHSDEAHPDECLFGHAIVRAAVDRPGVLI